MPPRPKAASGPAKPPVISRTLSVANEREIQADPLTRSLYVTACGYFAKAAWHNLPARTLNEHVLIYCIEGGGWMRLHERRLAVAAGDIFVCPAGGEHGYGSGQERPWTILWLHFSGEDAERFLERLQWDNASEPFRLGQDEVVSKALHSVLTGFAEREDTLGALESAQALRQVFLRWLTLRAPKPKIPREIQRVLKHVAAHYAHPLSVNDMAEVAGWSPSYFARQFSRVVGRAPVDHLVQLRVRHASELLVASGESVEAVARSVGYEDPYYFSRLFKGITGLSPRQFRRNLGVG